MKLKRSEAKKALIIGAAGFVGQYLIDAITAHTKWDIHATKLAGESIQNPNITVWDIDITQEQQLVKLLQELQPDIIYHLAAQSSVALAWSKPEITININVLGTLHLLEATRQHCPNARVILIGSGEEYGAVQPQDIPIAETVCPNPGNIYAITKNTQNHLGHVYAKAYNLDIISTRSFNHCGPGQAPIFVVADFCKQVATIEAGKAEPVLQVGNLAAKRDFTDVRDVVQAYLLLAEHGEPAETYNVGSGNAISIQFILDTILSFSNMKIQVERASAKYRPIDVPIIEANVDKLYNATGWQPQHSMEQTLLDTLNYWRTSLI